MESEEAQMMRRLQNGQVSDRDIQNIMESDGQLRHELFAIENKKLKEKEHRTRIYGDDAEIFDGVDKDGNLYQDIPLHVL